MEKSKKSSFKHITLFKPAQKLIPIFFATDDNYIPFLEVALRSLIENASPNHDYKIHILNTGLKPENMAVISKLENENFHVWYHGSEY